MSRSRAKRGLDVARGFDLAAEWARIGGVRVTRGRTPVLKAL